MDWLTLFHIYYEQADWSFRLLCDLLGGAILGVDREVWNRRVGIRTYMMVSLGAAVFTIVAVDMTARGLSADPSRVSATRSSKNDLLAKLREANALDPQSVKSAVLEATGDASVLHGGQLDSILVNSDELPQHNDRTFL